VALIFFDHPVFCRRVQQPTLTKSPKLPAIRQFFITQYAGQGKPIAFAYDNILWNKAKYGDFDKR
jgi:hypothetical protein